MSEIAAIMSIIVLFMSMYVLLKAWAAIDQAKQIMYLVYDWLEELESDRHECMCTKCEKCEKCEHNEYEVST